MRVLFIGAGHNSVLALREILHNKSHKFMPIGFLDDDQAKIGPPINGYPIFGKSELLKDKDTFSDYIRICDFGVGLLAPETTSLLQGCCCC